MARRESRDASRLTVVAHTLGVGDGVGVGVGLGDGDTVGDGEGFGVGVGVGEGLGDGDGVGVGVGRAWWMRKEMHWPRLLNRASKAVGNSC